MTEMRPCADRAGDLAALALGHLDADAAVPIRAHVDGCAACRLALTELRAPAALLPLADPARLSSAPVPPPDLGRRIVTAVRGEVRARRQRRHRRRFVAVGAAAAAVVLVVLATVAIVATGGGDGRRSFTVQAQGVEATFRLRANSEGTSVELVHEGLGPDDVYWLWLTDESGRRVGAGTFRGSSERSTVILQGALTADDAARIWVTDENDTVVLDADL